MKVEYKKDLRHNYMVITENDKEDREPYSIKMLESQIIEGILPIESRRMDNKILLYYDITAKQSMTAILDKTVLSYDKVRRLCTGIIDTIERAYEYLLPEDDFILTPEYIYIEVTSNKPVLCFLPGYSKRIKEQMSSLIEYLMNKVDYNDKEAVLLVYQLYADSREEGYTFDHLTKALQEKPQINIDKKRGEKESDERADNIADNAANNIINNFEEKETVPYRNGKPVLSPASVKSIYKESTIPEQPNNNDVFNKKDSAVCFKKSQPDYSNNIAGRMPVMMEKVEGEEEVPCYPLKTYLYTGACIAVGILLVILSLKSKIIYNSFGSRIDYSKLFALLLIVLCVEGYLIKLIWDKKSRITKIIAKNEYIDPTQNYSNSEFPKVMKLKKKTVTDNNHGKSLSQPDYSPTDTPAYQQNCAPGYKKNENMIKSQSDIPSMNKEINRRSLPKSICSDAEGLTFNHTPASRERGLPDITVNQEVEDNPTCLLNADYPEAEEDKHFSDNLACLILKPFDESKYQTISITELPFFIGKLKKNVDYCLENDAVSRYHAKITKEEEHYYITDLNSTNGTFVNSTAVQTYEKKEIKLGDEIAFANILYQFTVS